MAIRPLADRIVIERVAAPTTSSLLVIPDTVASEAPIQGKVIAVGPGRREKGQLVPMNVKVGDTVLFAKGTGANVNINKQNLLVMFEGDIMGVIGD